MTCVLDPRFFFGLLFALLVVRPCCAAAADVSISDAWTRATIGQATVTAGYATLTNSGAVDDQLLSVTADGVAKTEVHTTIRGDNGMMRMRPVHDLVIPAGEDVVFEGGGDHLMLTGIASPLKEGDEITLTFIFELAGEVSVVARVARRDPF